MEATGIHRLQPDLELVIFAVFTLYVLVFLFLSDGV